MKKIQALIKAAENLLSNGEKKTLTNADVIKVEHLINVLNKYIKNNQSVK